MAGKTKPKKPHQPKKAIRSRAKASENQKHRRDFDQLLDDAIFGVKKKNH